MTNEFIFIFSAALDLACVLILFRLFGKTGLIVSIVVNIILISTFGAKLTTLFGFVTNVGNVFYGTVFAAGILITKYYGIREGYRSVWAGLLALGLFILMAEVTLNTSTIPGTSDISYVMQTLFQTVVRIAVASGVAYVLSQHLNIWLFDRLYRSGAGSAL